MAFFHRIAASPHGLIAAATLLASGCSAWSSPEDEHAAKQTAGESGPQQALAAGPDFVVTSLQAPASAIPSGPLDVALEVCNHGASPDYLGAVHLVLSTDAQIDSTDTILAYAPGNYLAPGRCRTIVVSAPLPPNTGSFVLGAIADPDDVVIETDESNNTLAGGTLALGYEADLLVTALELPHAVADGNGFEVTATVCNHGQAPSSGIDVDFVLSLDEDIDVMTDAHAGNAYFGYLDIGACETQTVPAYAGVPEGSYVFGAVVDAIQGTPELSESNNVFVGPRLGVGWYPDLVVTGIQAPASALPWNAVEVMATVCNRGLVTSPGANLELVLSEDEAIDPLMDMPAGGRYVDYLQPDQCAVVAVPLAFSVPDGSYLLGAVIDRDQSVQELDEDNNTFVGSLLGVGSAPDLVITALDAPPSAYPGNGFEVTATVCNQGTASSGGVMVEATLLPAGASAPEGLFIGGMSTNHMPPGACETVRIPAYGGVYDGVYVVGAVVDQPDYEIELNESNNSFAGSILGVGMEPDLVVSAIDAPPTAYPGEAFDATVTVCNQGQSHSYGSDVELILSATGSVNMMDPPMGGAPLPGLDPGACSAVTVPGYAGGPEGVFTLMAVVDRYDYEPELIESNNTFAGPILGVGNEPDLVVTAIDAPPTARPGDEFQLSVTVCNQGQSPSYGSDVEMILSLDGEAAPMEPGIGAALLPSLQPDACVTLPVHAYPYGPEGVFTVIAVVDRFDYEPEINDDNNIFAGPILGVGMESDLVVTALDAPPTVGPGNQFEVTATVCNQGQGPSYGGDIELMLSSGNGVTFGPYPNPNLIGVGYVPDLPPGACITTVIPAYPYGAEGVFTLTAIVDRADYNPEIIESNNTFVGPTLGVGTESDLVVTALDAPFFLLSGSELEATVTVCNQGQSYSYGTELWLVLSSDASVDQNDMPIDGIFVPDLGPGMCMQLVVEGYVGATQGDYTLGAIVDPSDYQPEIIESNNTSPGRLLYLL